MAQMALLYRCSEKGHMVVCHLEDHVRDQDDSAFDLYGDSEEFPSGDPGPHQSNHVCVDLVPRCLCHYCRLRSLRHYKPYSQLETLVNPSQIRDGSQPVQEHSSKFLLFTRTKSQTDLRNQ